MDARIFIEPQQGTSYSEVVSLAQRAEELGFDGFFTSDHYVKMGNGDSGLPGPLDAWTTLAGLARDTERLRLGTLVSPITFRHPGQLAIQVAQIDEMSSGRIELGLGAGWFETEHAAYGLPFPPIKERFDRFSAPETLVWSPAQVTAIGATEAEFARRAQAIGREPSELRQNGIAGVVNEAVERLAAYADAGCTRMYLQILDIKDLEHLNTIAEALGL
ncbi:MAG: hypothetical protein ACI81L_001956 [Verrucomicrobiales bacterium]|jgi:hypothetical protein